MIDMNLLKASGYDRYHQVFNIQKFYILLAECSYMFCMFFFQNRAIFPYTALMDSFL